MGGTMGFKLYGIIALGLAGAYTAQQANKSMNYIETSATIKSVDFECTVEAYKRKLVNKETNKLAYMDCDLAKYAAEHHGYSKSSVKTHANLTYNWVSPADGSSQSKTHRTKVSDKNDYWQGQKINIFAHKSEPSKNYFK